MTSALGDLGAAFTESVVLHILAEEVTRSLAERPALSAMTELAVIVKSDTTHAPSFAQSSLVKSKLVHDLSNKNVYTDARFRYLQPNPLTLHSMW